MIKNKSYPGGKGGAGVYQNIINQMPPHAHYFELFLGSGVVMRKKKPAAWSTGVDIDDVALVNLKDAGIPNLELLCCDALDLLAGNHFSKTSLLYLDPPYPMRVRSSKKRLYPFEFSSDEKHLELLSLIKKIDAPVIISSYFSELYHKELSSWRYATFSTTNRAGKKTVESLWMNFPQPTALHDYRYLGRDFRERERIKRRLLRWKHRCSSIAPLERRALIQALRDSDIPSPQPAIGS